jgi:hypothetical protein
VLNMGVIWRTMCWGMNNREGVISVNVRDLKEADLRW